MVYSVKTEENWLAIIFQATGKKQQEVKVYTHRAVITHYKLLIAPHMPSLICEQHQLLWVLCQTQSYCFINKPTYRKETIRDRFSRFVPGACGNLAGHQIKYDEKTSTAEEEIGLTWLMNKQYQTIRSRTTAWLLFFAHANRHLEKFCHLARMLCEIPNGTINT